ncbi:MAG: EAL domain-containing protein [Pseudomonadota bacterium]
MRWLVQGKSLYGVSLVVGAVITALMLKVVWDEAIGDQLEIFAGEYNLMVDALEDRLKAIDETAYALQAVFDASTEIEPDEFRIVAEGIHKRNPYITAVMYAPHVPESQRARFISDQRDLGYVDFDIRPFAGEPAVAAQRDSLPLAYLEPFQPDTASLLGMDLLSVSRYRKDIAAAIRSGGNVVVDPDVFGIHPYGFSYFKAVYDGKSAPDRGERREAMVNGVLMLRISMSGLFEGVTTDTNMSVALLSMEAQSNDETVYYRPVAPRRASDAIDRFEMREPVNIGNKSYEYVAEKFLSGDAINKRPFIHAALFGLLITSVLVLLSRLVREQQEILQRRNSEINELVQLRTRELAFERDRAKTTVQSIGDGVITTDADGVVESMNLVAEQLTGWNVRDGVGKSIGIVFNLLDERTSAPMKNPVLRCLAEGVKIKLWQHALLVSRNGKLVAVDETSAPIFGETGALSGAVLVFRDVGKERELAQHMMYQATHDALTGLPNRTLLLDRIKQALAHAQHSQTMTAILFLDLDRFKIVNDTLGHNVGDILLVQVAQRLSRCLHADDTVSRLGGDEFVIVVHDIKAKEHVAKIAQRIGTQFKEPFLINNVEFYCTFSIGIVIYPDNGQDEFTLLKNADAAMYQAKAAGKNNFQFYSAEMNELSKIKLSLEADLRKAIERRELCLHYQPQVEAATGRIIGVEALVRWQHPARGMVSPAHFVPLAEETGLILPIGQWVLEEACRQNKAWQDAGYPPVQMAVNIANAQFQKPDLVQDVQKVLAATGLAPRYLELELTEGVLGHNAEASIATLKELRAMGVSLSIDDFGTGYSSLSYLKRFPLHTLKVDRAFVRDITTDNDDAAICSTIIAMAQNLNLSVVAEGVEDERQLEFLRQRGCQYIQGYYFSPPLPADKLAELLMTCNGHINTATYG